jgi:hypothetical protein
MIKRGRAIGVQAFLDVARTLAPRQLRKAHADQLLPAAEVTRADVVALGQARERLPVNAIENMSKDVAAGVHGRPCCPPHRLASNPSHPFCAELPYLEELKQNDTSFNRTGVIILHFFCQ